MCKSGKDLDKILPFFFLWLILVLGFALCVCWHRGCLQAQVHTCSSLCYILNAKKTSWVSHAPVEESAFWKQEVLTKCLLQWMEMICGDCTSPAIFICAGSASFLLFSVISSRDSFTLMSWCEGPSELGPSTMNVMLPDGHDCSQQSMLKCERWEQNSQVGMAKCLSVLWLGGHTIGNSAAGWLNWKKKFFLHHIRRGFGLLELPGWCKGRWGLERHSN